MFGRFDPATASSDDEDCEFGHDSFSSTKSNHSRRLSQSHGSYRTITQNDLFNESFNNDGTFSIIHFFDTADKKPVSRNLDLHFQELAKQYATCKFLRIDGRLAPFFTGKLGIKELPTVLVLRNGEIINRVSDFESMGFFGIREEWDKEILSNWIAESTIEVDDGAVTF